MNIYTAIPAIMAEVGAIGKDAYNPQGKFKYRGIDAVMNALNPALVKHKVFVVPEVLEQTREERASRNGGNLIYSICKVKFTFYADDGSSVSAVTIGEAFDSGDKATNKAMAISMKYALFQVFCIPTEEMKDPDAESHEVKPKEAIPDELYNSITGELQRTKVSPKSICQKYGVNSMNDLSIRQLEELLLKLKEYPTV